MSVEELAMNWWMLAGGLMALICTAGHAVAGWSMFYRPIRSAITNDLHAGVFRGMWHLITINFALSALALFVLGAYGRQDAVAWLIASQFAGYAAADLVISLRLGGAWKLFQWLPDCRWFAGFAGADAVHHADRSYLDRPPQRPAFSPITRAVCHNPDLKAAGTILIDPASEHWRARRMDRAGGRVWVKGVDLAPC